jgi:hypothetical protein
MPSELETHLVTGGMSPALAKVISNAIDNAATSRLSTGTNMSDATPVDKMRLIDADTRKYMLTNLDNPFANPFREKLNRKGVKYTPPHTGHPYEGSQPASSNPRLDTGSVKAGKFLTVSPTTTNEVTQSEVTLRVVNRGGTHARLNAATGEIESVPFLIQVEPQNKVEAHVEERPDATVLKLRLLT